MFSVTVITCSLFLLAKAQGPWVPEPLPDVTPPDVVNLFIQNAADGAGDYVASVVGVDSTATTFSITCNPHNTKTYNGHMRECGLANMESPVIVTQGDSMMYWTYAESGAEPTDAFSLSERCTFDGTTAKTATCTNSWGDEYPLRTDMLTTETPFTTLVYDGKLEWYTISYNGELHTESKIGAPDESANGPPPFIPVQITAGLEKLKAFAASVSTGSDASATGTAAKVTSTPSITSAAVLGTSTGAPGSATSITSTKTGEAVGVGVEKTLVLIVMALGMFLLS